MPLLNTLRNSNTSYRGKERCRLQTITIYGRFLEKLVQDSQDHSNMADQLRSICLNSPRDCRESIRKQILPSCRRIFRVRFVFVWFHESSEIQRFERIFGLRSKCLVKELPPL